MWPARAQPRDPASTPNPVRDQSAPASNGNRSEEHQKAADWRFGIRVVCGQSKLTSEGVRSIHEAEENHSLRQRKRTGIVGAEVHAGNEWISRGVCQQWTGGDRHFCRYACGPGAERFLDATDERRSTGAQAE